jgi:amino acid adenylation domain-containing protein
MTPRSAPGPDGRPTNPFEPFPRAALDQSIPARFASVARRWPERLAVKTGGDAWTYAALDRASNRIAHAVLDRLGPGNEPVVILLGQGVDQAAAVLGALKAGKIYVPLDPAHPPARLRAAIADTGARLVLTVAAAVALAREAGAGAATLQVDALGQGMFDAPGLVVEPDSGAYVFYTSGSTGQPKGVLDTHRNVLHNVMRYTNTLHLAADDRLTLLQGPSFSGAVSSLFGGLLNGAAVFPFDVARAGADRIAPWLAAEAITVYHSVPALFRQVAPHGASLPALRLIRLEGDQTARRDLELFRQYFRKDCVLVNGLGATECGLVRQFFFTPGQPLPPQVIPIGLPVEDMEILLLGDDGRTVPQGEAGEIAVRSRYLAAGYWRRPELTAARFLADPARSGSRIYRTGDLGRLQPGDVLEHLGRENGTAKVRGHRVEIADVESALAMLPNVAWAMAAVREDGPGEARLVAYLVPADGSIASVSALRRILAERLPDFMMPSAFVMLNRLPLNDNGKVDRRDLPAPGPERPALDVAFVSPRTPLEAALIDIWAETLSVTPIGVYDNFFDLGGDSLMAMAALARIASRIGAELSLEQLFDAPTVVGLAERIQRQLGPS